MKYDNKKYETIVHPLKPIFDKNSKILILGSFPSVKTREYGFFYGNPQNRFWKIMEILFDEKIEDDINSKKNFLYRKNIAMYDSIYKCDIIGSSDSSIKNVIPSNLNKIFKLANIKEVFLNGTTSYKYYNKYHKNLFDKGIKLPSTSPANARYSFLDLVKERNIILEYLK
ncbi:MAG: DNA-deoxyinosine glycosylase [Peptoniphilaceae bacterium]|nr:DNA-deoxyinosine glycosylase [Peptoniphilaceae bacterium]MDD7383693.1 DNA-deoxyinosine glycosylase [Peptoniphilaceae bacterium]MDY3738790.1 DNA-deoxyinosine glycosylase [Peptoniphilaceae bacterium]